MNRGNRILDAIRIHAALKGGMKSRPYLLRMCGGSHHRLARALKQLEHDGKQVTRKQEGTRVGYRLA